MGSAILQFGTSRFLQAHVDLFVSQALQRGASGAAVGGITVVQTTQNPASSQRLEALAAGHGYPVRLRGLRRGERVDETITCRAVERAIQADTHWPQLCDAMASDVQIVVSNTADRGYLLDERDGPQLIGDRSCVPRSFPAKLLVLLHHRWSVQPQAALSLFPCELVERNGDVLRGVVGTLARQWRLDDAFVSWLESHCVWANSLVDRIVSEAIHPVGAVAEPYALWAIEQQPGLSLPCMHEAMRVTDELERYERLKLFLLNAGHSLLAQQWLEQGRVEAETVLQAMTNPHRRSELESFWAGEVLPVFDALGQRAQAESYLVELRERLLNPFLAHRLADIAQNHEQKCLRRFEPIVSLATRLSCDIPQRRLRAALARCAKGS